jgi:hypothetical protein
MYLVLYNRLNTHFGSHQVVLGCQWDLPLLEDLLDLRLPQLDPKALDFPQGRQRALVVLLGLWVLELNCWLLEDPQALEDQLAPLAQEALEVHLEW